MGNLCFTEGSLQFSNFTHESLGSTFSLPPLFFLSLCSIFSLAPLISSTGGAPFSFLSPCCFSPWHTGGCERAQARGRAARSGARVAASRRGADGGTGSAGAAQARMRSASGSWRRRWSRGAAAARAGKRRALA
jgi:hypothetical protein